MPVLYGGHLMAITGKPFAATAGATVLQKGSNTLDGARDWIVTTSTMRRHSSDHGETYGVA